jgi:hypothetical protein
MTAIMNVKLNKLVEASLGSREEFKISTLCFWLPIAGEPDLVNRERRKLLYTKRMQILLKLAEEVDEVQVQREPFSRQESSDRL